MNLRQQDTSAAGMTAAVTGLTLLPVLPITIGAGQAVAHRGWIAAREAALAALRAGPCVVAVAGAPGTGKTLLLEELARVLGESGIATTMHRRGDLGGDETAGARDTEAVFRVALIDEADRMDEAALARLAAENRSGLVLARKQLPADGEADPLGEAVSGGRHITFVRLAPLLPGETDAFVHERLARAGHSGDVIGDAAIAAIERFSGRVPRLVNMLASAALFLAASNDAAQVDAEHVAEAAELRGLSVPAAPEEEPTTFDAPQASDAGEPASVPSAAAPAATAAAAALIPLGRPEQAGAASEPAPSFARASADRAPLILPAAEAARVLMARNAAAIPQPEPRSSSTARPVLRRAAILALCTVAGGAAAAGWLAWHETGSAADRQSSQSARAGTSSALAGPAGAPAAEASAVARAKPPPATAAAPTPAAAEPPPDGGKLASAAAPLPPPSSGTRALPSAPSAVAANPAPAPLLPPPSGTRALPSGSSAVASSSTRSSPVAPAVSPPPAATARGQVFAPTGPRPAHDVEPKALGSPAYATNEPGHAPTPSSEPRQSSQSAGTGTTSRLPQPSQGRLVAPAVVAATKPPPAKVAPSVPTAPKPPSVASMSVSAPALRTPPPAAAPVPKPQRLASSGAKAPPLVPDAVAPSPARPSDLATFVPPLPPTPTPVPTFAHTGPRPAHNTGRGADRFPAYATDGQAPAPNASLARAARSAGGWGPLSLDDLRRNGSPSRRGADPAPDVLGSVPASPESPAPPESRPAPQRYVGVYITQPDGRRTFISAQ